MRSMIAVFIVITLLPVYSFATVPLGQVAITYEPPEEEIMQKLSEMENGELVFEMPERAEYAHVTELKINLASIITDTKLRYLIFSDPCSNYNNGCMKAKIPANVLYEISKQHEEIYIELRSFDTFFEFRIYCIAGNAYQTIPIALGWQYPITLSIAYDKDIFAAGKRPVVYKENSETGYLQEYVCPRVWLDDEYVNVKIFNNAGVKIKYVDIESFEDTKHIDEQAQAILNELRLRGIVSGTSANNFSPDRMITKAEFITMIMKLPGWYDPDSPAQFMPMTYIPRYNDISDVPVWAGQYIWQADSLGIVRGDGSGAAEQSKGNLNPNKAITREEMYAIAYRVLSSGNMFLHQRYTPIPGKDGMLIIEDSTPPYGFNFEDAREVSLWASAEISNLYNYTRGLFPFSELFEPNSFPSRLEAAEFIWLILQYDAR